MLKTRTNLYQQILEITEEYLGQAADRFMRRQIVNHLHKQPEEIDAQDIATLAEWVKVSVALLTEDKTLVDGYETKLRQLGE
jgi:hypothetical protein